MFIRRQEIATRCVRERIIVVTRQPVTISFTREALFLVHSTVVSLAFSRRVPSEPADSSPASFIPPPFWPPSRGAEDSASHGALVGDCYVRKKPSRTKSVDNLNYISHHNSREPVKPTPAFCLGAPRVGSSEWAPVCHTEVTPPLCRSLFSSLLASTLRLTPLFFVPFLALYRPRRTCRWLTRTVSLFVKIEFLLFDRKIYENSFFLGALFIQKIVQYLDIRKTVNFTVLQQKPRKLQLRLSIGTERATRTNPTR